MTPALLTTLLFAAAAPQAPLRIGVVVADAAAAEAEPCLRGARLAEASLVAPGGGNGDAVELVVAAAAGPAQVAAAIGALQAAGAVAVVAPPEPSLAAVVRRVAQGKLACVAHAAAPAAIAQAFDHVCTHTFCMQYVGLVRDGDRSARELERVLTKSGLTPPARLLWTHEAGAAPKAWPKLLAKEGRPHLVLLDAEPEVAARFLTEVLGEDPLPIVLTPRAVGAATRALARGPFAILGLSPASSATSSEFRRRYEHEYGDLEFGAAEGFEGVLAIARAAAAGARDAVALRTALPGVVVDGARGRVPFDRALDGLAAPLAVWQLAGPATHHYAPPVVPLTAVGASPGTSAGTAPAANGPQAGIGEPFGTWRTRQFVFEDGAQWVLCCWAGPEDPGFATADEDLVALGLSTGGKDPILDHLVREEIMARVLAIVSTKFGRREDGTGIPGRSLRISFAAHVDPKEREKKKQRLWPARFGGDHTGAGGEAFGTYCRVYTAFIRRTIFQPHALVPPLEPADRAYLDGGYRFGTDLARDKRSELIRALINGYAGSMALTLAHEVGHLAGLEHVTDDPVEIMNVEEGAGIDYRDAHFGPATWAIMQQRYGLVGEPPGAQAR
jgi:ABC-type branched-subunit amino acid transport system substrate-binding protein